jgi:plasmid maintenance system antidote protein VapI
MEMYDPPHPGEIVREDCLKALGGTPEHWLQMQLAYDLWQAKRRAKKLHVKQFFAASRG